MKKKRIIPMYFCLIALSATIPFFVRTDKPWELVAAFMTAASVMSASFYAFRYFDPFDLRKKSLVKQYDSVLTLLECITGFSIKLEVEDPTANFLFDRRLYDIPVKKKEITKFLDGHSDLSRYKDIVILVNTENISDVFTKVNLLKNNMWLPKKIAGKINIFSKEAFDCFLEQESEISIILSFKTLNSTEYSELYVFDDVTLLDFILEIRDIIKESEKWLKRKSFSSKFLNL